MEYSSLYPPPTKYCLTGSFPLFLEGFIPNCPKDIDFVIPHFYKDEFEVIKNKVKEKFSGYFPNFAQRVEGHIFPDNLFDIYRTSFNKDMLKALYTLKLSHSFFNVHWRKTNRNLLWFESTCGTNSFDSYLFDNLYPFWVETHKNITDKSKITMNVTNEEFFCNKVPYIYEHDSLHAATAFIPNHPLYRYVLKEEGKPLVSEEKFNNLPFEYKLRLAKEEITVIALERFILPETVTSNLNNFDDSEDYFQKAWELTTQQLVTTMTKGFFPKFIMNNRQELFSNSRGNLLDLMNENKHLLKRKES